MHATSPARRKVSAHPQAYWHRPRAYVRNLVAPVVLRNLPSRESPQNPEYADRFLRFLFSTSPALLFVADQHRPNHPALLATRNWLTNTPEYRIFEKCLPRLLPS